MINHIQKSRGMNIIDTPTIIYEDNVACVAQMHMGYVKSNLTKHIAPKFFYPPWALEEWGDKYPASKVMWESCRFIHKISTRF